MPDLTPEGAQFLADIAKRHGVGVEAARVLLGALAAGGGRQAQFNHPDLGGMGQWSQGGMIMVGDMFNHGLKTRVDALCNELASLLHSQSPLRAAPAQSQSQPSGAASLFVAGSQPSGQWWPGDLGAPASTGAQNDLRYAFFPGARRLAIQQGGLVRVYDTGEHQLFGFGQQQGADQSLTFTSQFGLVRVADLPLVSPLKDQSEAPSPPPSERAPKSEAAATAAPAPNATMATADILKAIEGIAELRRKDILSEEEFAAKKAELLARL